MVRFDSLRPLLSIGACLLLGAGGLAAAEHSAELQVGYGRAARVNRRPWGDPLRAEAGAVPPLSRCADADRAK